MKHGICITLEGSEVIEACNDYCRKLLGPIYIDTDSIDLAPEEEVVVAYMSVNVDFEKGISRETFDDLAQEIANKVLTTEVEANYSVMEVKP